MKTQQRVIDREAAMMLFIDEWWAAKCYAPSLVEICHALNIARSGAQAYLIRLADKKFIVLADGWTACKPVPMWVFEIVQRGAQIRAHMQKVAELQSEIYQANEILVNQIIPGGAQ